MKDQDLEGNLKRWINKKLPDVLGYVISSELVYLQKLDKDGVDSSFYSDGFCKVEIMSNTTTTFTGGAYISSMPISNVTFELPKNSGLDNKLPPVPRNTPMSTPRQPDDTENSKDDKVLSVAPSNQNFQPHVEPAGNNQMPGSPPLQPVTSAALFRPDDPPNSVPALSDPDVPLTVSALFYPTTVGNQRLTSASMPPPKLPSLTVNGLMGSKSPTPRNVPGPNSINEQSRQYATTVSPTPGIYNPNNMGQHTEQAGSGLGLGKKLGDDVKPLGLALVAIIAQLVP